MIGQAPSPEDTSEGSHYSQIFKLGVVHLLAFFTLVYVGVEVTIGGEIRAPWLCSAFTFSLRQAG